MFVASDITVGANAGRARSHNRQVVLDRVRTAGRVGRAEIARASGLTTQAVSNIIADLLEDGLIVEQGRHAAGRGLPAVQYALNASGGYALGVEIRPDAVFAAVLNLCGETVAADRRDLASPDRDSVTETMLGLRDHLLKASGTPPDRLLGAGVVMPGPFGATGIRDSGSELPSWAESAPDHWFSEALELPVVIENDANAAAIAERIVGVAQGLETYAFIYFGSGIGLGVVQNGRLITGAHGNAGEIGHIPVPAGGESVPLESRVSRLSVQRALAGAGITAASVSDLDRLYAARTPELMAWLDAAAEPLSAAIAIVENLFDPSTVILGGAMPDTLLDHLIGSVTLAETSVARRDDRTTARLLRGASGRMTATLGAAAIVINHAFTPKIAA
ncbi:ROK family transcriptional regulator [Ovoidimarina sediminis]|uniref:ROK family transcriptional regulator n=1 Tax=Ovoidimarina sediminis TaxID=3079856 RepID=UPI00290F4C7E|nr:ROK family transcriptional regulator [Rhodophyticola sp. MJ-SS7]MDU8946217.1 ROK family transcriptional regulator [Rhodophyticola sp. MJ-SS7]